MKGVRTEPSPKIIRPPKIKSNIAIGINQYFFLTDKNFKNSIMMLIYLSRGILIVKFIQS